MVIRLNFSAVSQRNSPVTSQYSSAYTGPEQHLLINHLSQVMTSVTSSGVQQLIQNINVDGFFSLKDPTKGLQAEEFTRKRFPITTIEEIEFVKAHTFNDLVNGSYSLYIELI